MIQEAQIDVVKKLNEKPWSPIAPIWRQVQLWLVCKAGLFKSMNMRHTGLEIHLLRHDSGVFGLGRPWWYTTRGRSSPCIFSCFAPDFSQLNSIRHHTQVLGRARSGSTWWIESFGISMNPYCSRVLWAVLIAQKVNDPDVCCMKTFEEKYTPKASPSLLRSWIGYRI